MKISTIAIAAALAGALTVTAVQSLAQRGQPQAAATQGRSPSATMHQIMMTPMQSMKMSGDTDRDFAMMMYEHHGTALKMAEVEVKYGKNAKLKALAKKMIVQQQKERQELLKYFR